MSNYERDRVERERVRDVQTRSSLENARVNRQIVSEGLQTDAQAAARAATRRAAQWNTSEGTAAPESRSAYGSSAWADPPPSASKAGGILALFGGVALAAVTCASFLKKSK